MESGKEARKRDDPHAPRPQAKAVLPSLLLLSKGGQCGKND